MSRFETITEGERAMQKSSVDAFTEPRTVKGRTANIAFHQFRQPVSFLTLDPANLEPDIVAIVARVACIERARSCGAYLFIDPDLRAFVITEEKPMAREWLRTHFPWLVALYAPKSTKGVPALAPTLQGVTEDVKEHLADLAGGQA